MTNVLSRKRLEAALRWTNPNDDFTKDHSVIQTIQKAINFLLNPEPTDEMMQAAEQEHHHDDIFTLMIAELTKDDNDEQC